MRALKRIREDSRNIEGSFESLIAQFSATTLELNPALGTSEFARRLTTRAAEMLGARAAVLAIAQGSEWEIAALSGQANTCEVLVKKRLAAMLCAHAALPSQGPRAEAASTLLGHDLAATLGWEKLLLAKLTRSDSTILGALCLVDVNRNLSPTECQLLEALASHASVALENVQLFSRIEQSRKQWVEDFDAISDFIVVHDSTGRVLRLNRSLADHLGVHPTEAIGWEVGGLEILASASHAGPCPFCRDSQSLKEESTHLSGERNYLISTSRIRGSEENDLRTIHVMKDITAQREAERRYCRERDFNKNILNNTQSLILVLDTKGLISFANRRCFEAGYQEHNLLGYRLAEKVPLARRPFFEEALDRTLQGIAIDGLELPLLRGNGSVGQFSISLSPMRDERGNIHSVVVVMADITDAADLQAKLMHTEKMAALGQLVSGVAHEVNNPLAAIIGFTDLLLESHDIPDDAKQDLKVILDEAQRTRVIVQNLLSFARQMPAAREPIQVNSVLKQTLRLRTYDLSNSGVELSPRYQEELPLTIGDPNQLQQVFLNILNNAYDAIHEVQRLGKIEISTSFRDGQLEIVFRDNGPGIGQPDRIFDPFFTTKEVGKGTGLGLSICYGIVRAHRGEIVARNNPDGVGCEFIVRLPAAAIPAEMLAGATAV